MNKSSALLPMFVLSLADVGNLERIGKDGEHGRAVA